MSPHAAPDPGPEPYLPFPFPLPPTTTPAPAPDVAPDLLPRDLDPRQASIVTQTIVASTGISAPTGGSSSSSGGGFPVAVAVPALIGGMALALLAALGWWWYQRRKTRERKRRWEARQKRQQRKRAPSNSTARPSFSTQRPGNSRATTGMSEKEKDIGMGGLGMPPVPPLPSVPKEYDQQQQQQQQHHLQPVLNGGYQYANDDYGRQNQGYDDQYSQDAYGHSVQPGIDAYGAAANPFTHASDAQQQQQQSYQSEEPVEEYKPNGPAALGGASSSSSGSKSSRSAKRVEVADQAAAREQADRNTRWKPNKPSPLALAAEKKRLENATATSPIRSSPAQNSHNNLSPGRSDTATRGYNRHSLAGFEPPTPNSNSGASESSWEYQEELTTPNDPDYSSRRSEDRDRARQVSGEWGVAGGISSAGSAESHYAMRQSEDGQARGYTNDPYLNPGSGSAAGYAGNDDSNGRLQSGQYSIDPYAGYHGDNDLSAGGQAQAQAQTGGKKAKVGGWV